MISTFVYNLLRNCICNEYILEAFANGSSFIDESNFHEIIWEKWSTRKNNCPGKCLVLAFNSIHELEMKATRRVRRADTRIYRVRSEALLTSC